MNSRRFSVALLVALLGAGCAVGPDFKRPAPPAVRVYDTPESAPAAEANAAAAERPNAAASVPARWWQLFKSPPLDETLRLALASNATVDAARATLAAAREAVIVARAGFLPRLGASAAVQRSGGGNPPGPAGGGSLYQGGLTGTYTFNALGGATRRLLEQQEALVDTQRFELAGAQLTLTGSVVSEALVLASTRLQIQTTQELIQSDEKTLALTQRMFEVGTVTRADVLTADSQLAADQATLPALRQQLSVARHALAILVGRAPGEWSAPEFELTEFALPGEMPYSLPSELVRQRPDILAAEAQLHAASAAVGIALAQEYPGLTLTANLTRESLSATDLFHNFDSFWSAGAALTQPIFQGGALRAQTRAARDLLAAQAATYRQVVLEAFGQVADDLRALEHDAERVAAYHRSLRAAADSLALQRASYTAGKTTILQLIDAERSYAQAVLGSASAEASQLQDCVQLFIALGGAWQTVPAEVRG
jgi:NodT family efflux transporter outer membrane factor (OMF) lipoprotein